MTQNKFQIFKRGPNRSIRSHDCRSPEHQIRSAWMRTDLLLLLQHDPRTAKRSSGRTAQIILRWIFWAADDSGRRLWPNFLHFWPAQGWLWRVFFLWVCHGLPAFSCKTKMIPINATKFGKIMLLWQKKSWAILGGYLVFRQKNFGGGYLVFTQFFNLLWQIIIFAKCWKII